MPMQRGTVAGKPGQMHFGPGQHTYMPQQGFQYPGALQPGGQPYLAMLPQQQGQNPGVSQPFPTMQRPVLPQNALQVYTARLCLD